MIKIVLLIAILVVVTVTATLLFRKKGKGEETAVIQPDSDCCGAHEVCEKDSLLSSTSEIIYFEDEDLDRFAGREATSYTPEEIDEIADVLYTLKENEVAEWLRSLQIRNIELPIAIRDEALLIIRERRGL